MFTKIRYNQGEEIFEVKVKDSNGANIENWVFMKRDFGKWVKTMEARYGVKKEDRDLDWLN